MHLLSRAVAVAVVLSSTFASAAIAQRRTDAGAASLARREAPPVALQQPAAATMTGPEWSIYAGVASGDGAYDVGLVLGGTGRWHRSDWPVGIRGDAHFAHHSGSFGSQASGFDVSLNIIGVMGSAEYTFPTTGILKPYAFGGFGLFYSNVNVDYSGELGIEDSNYDSSIDLGLGIGGGLRLSSRFGIELRVMDIGGFTTIPLVGVLHF